MKSLIDPYGRRVRKLRVSLTDKCNLRCRYCMPVDSSFMPEDRLLSPEKYFEIVEELVGYGLEEVRLTGGEPLMRKSLTRITELLSTLPLKKLAMTTNAVFLDRHLRTLREHRVDYLNISLDSLSAESFRRITHGGDLHRVLANIELAKAMGFQLKLNMVAMKGINDHEIFAFVEYAKRLQIEVRFLELMRIGFACGSQKEMFISAEELIGSLKSRYDLTRKTMSSDSTSFNFTTSCGAQIGFIASESKAFCSQCSRWRLSADGMLRACLLRDDGISIRDVSPLERQELYQQVLRLKPAVRGLEVAHLMNQIGG